MERVRDNPDEEVKSLMENKSMRRIIFHSPTIRKTLKSKEVNMGKLTQEQMLIVKGTEHPEEFTPKRLEQGLLLTEIRETLDKLTTSWYRDDKEAWLDVASEDILPKVLKASKNKCVYCDKKPDGAMLTMGFQMAHATCVIQKLNELLDPNYDGGEPDKVVGFLAGYKSQEEVEARIQEAEK